MNKLSYAVILLAVVTAACNQHKPKPISKNITKTTVVVNHKKDSVINNPQHNYGTATISEPCEQVLLKNIQGTPHFKQLTTGKKPSDITYMLNWVKAEKPKVLENGGRITNGIEAVVYEKQGSTKQQIGSYLFNNENAKLYYLNGSSGYDELAGVDAAALKQIRNACYWGQASH